MTHQPTRRLTLKGIAAASAGIPFVRAHAAAEEIVIGQSTHLTGPLAVSMVPVLKGQDLAIEEFNKKGGVGGRPVRLVVLDDAYDPKRSVENVHTLIDKEGVVALHGLGSTAGVAAVLPVLTEKKVPLIGVYTGANSIRTGNNRYFFSTIASYRDEIEKMVKNLASTQRRRIGLFVMNNAFGKEMTALVDEVCKEQGSTLVATQPVDNTGSNAIAASRTIGEARPDGVIAMVFGPMFIQIVKATRSYIGVPIYAPTIANSRAIVTALGDDARGIAFTRIMPNALRQTTTVTRDYAAVMRSKGMEPDYDHFFGYLPQRAMLETLKRAGPKLTPQSLVASTERMGKVDLGGYKLEFGPGAHHGSKFVDLSIVGPGGRYIW